MLKIDAQFKEAQKVFTDLEKKIIPNTTKLVMNQGVNAGIKEASKALKDQWKVTKSGKDKNSITFDKKDRSKGKSSAPWLAQIKFFKVREARNKELSELESNFRFLRPRRMPGLMAFTVGNKTPAKQMGIGMRNRRFPRKRTQVFIRGKRQILASKFMVKVNNAIQIFTHKNTGKKKHTLAKQVVANLDSGINREQIKQIETNTRAKINQKFGVELTNRLAKSIEKYLAVSLIMTAAGHTMTYGSSFS